MDPRDAQRLAAQLMHDNGLSGRVGFGWMARASLTFGRYTVRKVRDDLGNLKVASETIQLSKALVQSNSEARVRETILHEIAHALAGIDAGHGPLWAGACLRLGIQPRQCGAMGIDTEPPLTGWHAHCAQCGHHYHAARLPTRRISCGRCSQGFREDLVVTWEHYKTKVRATHGYPKSIRFLDSTPKAG
jgi:predicted SprT family Zn-dependent metalloprotease